MSSYIHKLGIVVRREDQWLSLSTNHALLMRSSNQLLRSLGGLLKGASDCKLKGTYSRMEHCQDSQDESRCGYGEEDYSVSM